MLQFLGGRALTWTARSPHGMTWKIRRPWWPPFFTTDLWPPRVRMWFTNEGEDLIHDIGFQLDIVEYDGRIGELPRATGWTDTTHVSLNEPRWLSGETRRFLLKAKGRELPHPGNYAMRLSVAKFTPIPGAPPGVTQGSEVLTGYIFARFRVRPNTDLGRAAATLVTTVTAVIGAVALLL